MRLPACALALCLLPFMAPGEAPAVKAPAPAARTPAALAAPASPAAAAAAAARHAKRVRCRKQAMEKRIRRADQLEFVKRCLAAH